MSKTMYTNVKLFNAIVDILKEKNLLPDILDYHLSESECNERKIKTCEWDTIGIVNFGSCEGIYLDVYIKGNIGDGLEKVKLGTFKTLGESREDFYTMSRLQADFTWETRSFVNSHMDDFNWTGYDVKFFKGEKGTAGYWTSSKEGADKLIKKCYNGDFDYVIIINNENCKETKMRKDEIALG